MENIDNAKLTRNLGHKKFWGVLANQKKIANDKVMLALVKRSNTNSDNAAASAALTTVTNTGFSADKLDKKMAMAKCAATLCASAQLRLEDLNRHPEAEQLHEYYTYYSTPADTIAQARAEEIYTLLNNNIADFDPDYVSKSELDDYRTLINDYVDCKGSTVQVNATSPALTAAFKADLKKTDKDVEDIKKRALKYASDTPFYDALLDVLKTPPVPNTHTQVHVVVIDAATGLPLPGVLISISRSKNTIITNAAGISHYDTCPNGLSEVTASLTGFDTFKGNYNIEQAKVNTINISLNKSN